MLTNQRLLTNQRPGETISIPMEQLSLRKEKTMEKIKKVEIHDKVFEETYTAHIRRNGTGWLGWIPDVPKVKCEEPTQKVLLETLENKLHEALVAEEEAWEKKFEADVKAGKLEQLREEAFKDVQAGRFKYL